MTKSFSLKDETEQSIKLTPDVVTCQCGRPIENKLADMNDGKIHLCNNCVERLLLKSR